MPMAFKAGGPQRTFDDFLEKKKAARAAAGKHPPRPRARQQEEGPCKVQFGDDGERTWFCREKCTRRTECSERRED